MCAAEILLQLRLCIVKDSEEQMRHMSSSRVSPELGNTVEWLTSPRFPAPIIARVTGPSVIVTCEGEFLRAYTDHMISSGLLYTFETVCSAMMHLSTAWANFTFEDSA